MIEWYYYILLGEANMDQTPFKKSLKYLVSFSQPGDLSDCCQTIGLNLQKGRD